MGGSDNQLSMSESLGGAQGISFDIFADEEAVAETKVGQLAEHVVSGLTEDSLSYCGNDEPLSFRWDQQRINEAAKTQMPVSSAYYGGSQRGSWVSVRVVRADTGLLVRSNGCAVREPASLPTNADSTEVSFASIANVCEILTASYKPRFGLFGPTTIHSKDDFFGRAAGLRPSGGPIAILLGPRAVNDLELEVNELKRRHDLIAFGPGRVPSVLFRFRGSGPWESQLSSILNQSDLERLLQVFGFVPKNAG